MNYAHPGTPGAIVSFKSRYGNYIGGEFVAPVKGGLAASLRPGGRTIFGEAARCKPCSPGRWFDPSRRFTMTSTFFMPSVNIMGAG
eukprot:gene39390-48679_t